ncbi:MAG: type II secretion system F family protein [Candidatus Krumholzibacteriia bacterium]|nr:type II secretion system F family protein [bacterium]MCB9514965.1 type II secretion system F family protein [Candidatus Latescibacterota bacterium]
MASFVWQGISLSGKRVSGVLEADSKADVLKNLRKQKIRITLVQEQAAKKGMFSRPKKIKVKDLGLFTRQFATMISAGLPLIQCLEVLAQQMDHPELRSVISQVTQRIEGGSTLNEALRDHPVVFNELFTSMVEAGETGGILDTILERLATHLEKMEALIRKIKGAMTYPLVVFSVSMGATAFMLLFLIPRFAAMFADFGGELPLPTKIVMMASDGLKHYGWVLVILIVGGLIFLKRYRATYKGARKVDAIMLRIPVIGQVVRKGSVSRFSRTLGTLLASGVPLLDGLNVTARAAGNTIVSDAVGVIRTSVTGGSTLAEPMRQVGVFPPMVTQMVSVGEETGRLDEMLGKLADFYDDEVDAAVDSLTAVIEPVMIVVMGLIVGGMLIAMYLPMFKLISVVSGG